MHRPVARQSPSSSSSPAACARGQLAHKAALWLVLLVALACSAAAAACDDKKPAGDDKAPESEGEAETQPGAETAAAPVAEEAGASGEAAAPSAEALDPASPEARFLAVLAEFATILDQPGDPASVAEAFATHYAAQKERIVEVARALQTQRSTMSPDEQDALEDKLAQRPEATAFNNAIEAFQGRATAEQFKRVEDVMLEIYEAAGQGE